MPITAEEPGFASELSISVINRMGQIDIYNNRYYAVTYVTIRYLMSYFNSQLQSISGNIRSIIADCAAQQKCRALSVFDSQPHGINSFSIRQPHTPPLITGVSPHLRAFSLLSLRQSIAAMRGLLRLQMSLCLILSLS